jgi:hypothetical protein
MALLFVSITARLSGLLITPDLSNRSAVLRRRGWLPQLDREERFQE